MTDEILKLVGSLSTPGFFVTIEFNHTASYMPTGIESFILQKLEDIRSGIAARKFVYTEGEWRMFFTFFPTDRVVDEKYAMKNYAVKSPTRFKIN